MALSAAALGTVGCPGDDDSAVDAAVTQADVRSEDRGDLGSSGEQRACSLLSDDEGEAQVMASATQEVGGYQITSTETSEPEHSVHTYQWDSD